MGNGAGTGCARLSGSYRGGYFRSGGYYPELFEYGGLKVFREEMVVGRLLAARSLRPLPARGRTPVEALILLAWAEYPIQGFRKDARGEGTPNRAADGGGPPLSVPPLGPGNS